MRLKSCRYMEKPEFKAQQDSFDFFCEAAYEFLLKFQNDCRAGWHKFTWTKKIAVKTVQESFFDTLDQYVLDKKKEPKPLFCNSIAL